MLSSSRDENDGNGALLYRGGERRRARYATPDLSYYWEGGRE